jgi:sulfofructose kinase
VRDEIVERLGQPGRALDVIGYGECSIDEVWVLPTAPDWGGKLRAARRERLGGGQVATAMVACARLGLKAAFCGVVGDDDDGRQVLAGLAAEGVDVTAAWRVPGGVTRAALILVDERNGERAVVEHTQPRPLSLLPHVVPARIAEARILHLDATDPGFAREAARRAREAGTVVSLDVDHPAPGLDELLRLADIVITSRGLPQQLTGEADLERALRKLAEGVPGLVGCTLGADGAALLDDGHLLLSPAFPTEVVVDTTACGDTFRAALLVALAEGQRPSEGLRFANAAAALKARDLGRRGCPMRAEVNALLARQ